MARLLESQGQWGRHPSGQEKTGTVSPPKQAKHMESAVVTQKGQISSLTAQNEKMIATLITSGIEIPNFDPSWARTTGRTARWWQIRRISASPRPIRERNERPGGLRGTQVICPMTMLQLHWSKQLSPLVVSVIILES